MGEDSIQNERIARMEEQIKNTHETVGKMEKRFDALEVKEASRHAELKGLIEKWGDDVKRSAMKYADNAATSKVRDLGGQLFADKEVENDVRRFKNWWLGISGVIIVVLVITVAILIRSKTNISIPLIE